MSDAIGNHVSHWHVSDTHFEACGCAVICPCRKQRGVRAGMRSAVSVEAKTVRARKMIRELRGLGYRVELVAPSSTV